MTMQLHLQQVPARNGRLWIRHGFKVFQRQPLALASLFGLFLFAGFVAMLLPGVGLLLTFASLPLLSLGFMLATHLVLQKKTPTASVFVAPLKLTPERRRPKLRLHQTRTLWAVCAVLAAAALGMFVFLAPFTYAIDLGDADRVLRRRILPSWSLHYSRP